MKKAVKNAGKRIKKDKKKTIIETVALVLILTILFGVIGMYRFILYAAKADHEAFNNSTAVFNQNCESVSVDLIDKKDYENDSASLYVGEKYKIETIEEIDESKTEKIVINKDKYIHIIEHESGLMVYGMSEYLRNHVFPPARPFVKWGVDLMGYEADFAPGYDLALEEEIIEMEEPDVPFFCSLETYSKALAYYSIKNSMGVGTGYLLVKNDEFYCIGTKLHNGDNKLYTFVIQSKSDLNKSMQMNFFGYDNQDDVVEVLSSLKLK